MSLLLSPYCLPVLANIPNQKGNERGQKKKVLVAHFVKSFSSIAGSDEGAGRNGHRFAWAGLQEMERQQCEIMDIL